MVQRKKAQGQMKPQRIKVEIGTEGAYLWAPFGDHMKAGLLSLLPVLVINLVASAGFVEGNPSVSDRIVQAVNSTGQLIATFGWVLIFAGGLYCAAWGAMSMGLVRLFRYRPSFYLHLAAHAVAGAVIVGVLSVWILSVGQRDALAGAPVWDSEYFQPLVVGAPAVGAIGAAAGMWALKSFLYWYVTKEREPLKDVFTFVEGHHQKDEFERL
ncbi:MAG: hypothetical protein JW722_03650 [Demequinaceae bacterium]|nr:hypothetical protein [Demequinaceae bacterium]